MKKTSFWDIIPYGSLRGKSLRSNSTLTISTERVAFEEIVDYLLCPF
jgi:hypothetical protein